MIATDPQLSNAQASARAEQQRRLVEEKCRYWVPNGGIERFLTEFNRRFRPGSNRIYIAMMRGGNGLSKTVTAVSLASYLSDNYPNAYLDKVDYLREFQRPNRGRILTTPNAAENNYDMEFTKWLRRGRYKSSKRGRNFNDLYRFPDTGSQFDVFTFKQDPSEGESITLNWAIVDEPMSRAHFKALKFRFRFGGIIFLFYTDQESEHPAFYSDEFETIERLSDDVLCMELSAEENCITHGIRGMMPHEALQDQWRDCDDDDLLARRDGKSRAKAGAIYNMFRDDPSGHTLPEFPPYYADCWAKGLYTLWQRIDPHGRKPWATNWRAFFPDGKSFCVAEWPDMSMRPFHKIKSWHWGFKQYAKLTKITEAALGVGKPAHATIMDPNYGPSASMTGETVSSIAEEFFKAYKAVTDGKLRRMFFPDDAVVPGHMKVKGLLGDPFKGVTPDYFWLEHCHNSRFGMSHYGYKENHDERRGQSEMPMLQYKDFPDLERYGAEAGERYIAPLEPGAGKMIFFRPKIRPNGHVGV